MTLTMAAGAVVSCRVRLFGRDPMLNLVVAMQTFHLVFGHVDLVQLFRLSVLLQPGWFVMASQATVLRHVAFTANNVGMAPLALHVEFLHIGMMKGETRSFDGLLRYVMAERAPRSALPGLLVFEMTEKAGGRGHGDVPALNDLRMTRRATQFLVAPHFHKVRRVIERHAAETDLSLHETAFVACQAVGVVHFGPRMRAVRSCKISRHHRKRFVFLSKFRSDSRRDMAFHTQDLVVMRAFPRFVVRLHVVTASAELGAGSDFKRSEGEQHCHSKQHRYREHDLSESGQTKTHTSPGK